MSAYDNVGVDTNPYAMSVGIPGIDALHSYARGPIGEPTTDRAVPMGGTTTPGPWSDSREPADQGAEEWRKRHASKAVNDTLVIVETGGEPAVPGRVATVGVTDPRRQELGNYRMTQQVNMLGTYDFTRVKSPYGARMHGNDAGTHGGFASPAYRGGFDSANTQRGRKQLRQTQRVAPAPLEAQISTQDQNVPQGQALASGSSLTRWY